MSSSDGSIPLCVDISANIGAATDVKPTDATTLVTHGDRLTTLTRTTPLSGIASTSSNGVDATPPARTDTGSPQTSTTPSSSTNSPTTPTRPGHADSGNSNSASGPPTTPRSSSRATWPPQAPTRPNSAASWRSNSSHTSSSDSDSGSASASGSGSDTDATIMPHAPFSTNEPYRNPSPQRPGADGRPSPFDIAAGADPDPFGEFTTTREGFLFLGALEDERGRLRFPPITALAEVARRDGGEGMEKDGGEKVIRMLRERGRRRAFAISGPQFVSRGRPGSYRRAVVSVVAEDADVKGDGDGDEK